MVTPLAARLQAAILGPDGLKDKVVEMLNSWGDDMFDFVRHQIPRIIGVFIIAFILSRLLKAVSRRLTRFSTSQGLPSSMRAQQLLTLSSVIYSVGLFIIVFVAALQVLPLLGINMGPLLASAGIAGVAVGFGAQTLVHDFINGFFILVENQYDIGDVVRIAGVKGTVERMSLRMTVLRDEDGTIHMVPNSTVQIVSNTTRDWAQIALRVTVAYSEPSEKIITLLNQIGEQMRHDPAFADEIVSDIQVPGIDRVGNGEVEYLMLIKTRPSKQYAVSRELRRRIKTCFEQNKIQTAGPGRVYVVDQATAK